MKRWRGGGVEVLVLSERGGVSTGVLVRARGAALLVDCGDGISRDLADMGVAADELAGVVLTHDHADHVAGLTGLFWLLRLAGRKARLPVLRPKSAALAAILVALYKAVLWRPGKFAIAERTLADRKRFRVGPFTVASFPVRHRRSVADPPGRLMETYGLSVRVAGRRIVISSDTGPSERLVAEVDGADLAVIEANFDGRAKAVPPNTHLTVAQARVIGRRAKARLLYHRAFKLNSGRRRR